MEADEWRKLEEDILRAGENGNAIQEMLHESEMRRLGFERSRALHGNQALMIWCFTMIGFLAVLFVLMALR